MEWRRVLFSLCFIVTLVESSGRSGAPSSVNISRAHTHTLLYSWTICSAAIFILVALILSIYLVFEHLTAYNQPEEQKFMIGLILMVPVYAVESMGISAVVHLYVFPAVPYKLGERCVHNNAAVMSDCASLGTDPDPEEARDCERYTRINIGRNDEREKRLNFPQSVRDVVVGSGEIIVGDM